MQALRSALTPWRALLLAALLLMAQAAGLGHRVAHGPSAAAAAGAAGAELAPFWGHAAPQEHAHARTHVHADDHGQPASDAAAECRLYDQLLGHADVLLGALPADVGAPADLAGPGQTRLALARRPAAAYQARAPPLA